MLLRLSVRNFILIDKLDLDFTEGLCVITGETGAGKSILIDSLLFCLGGRFNANIIKQNLDAATVVAEFNMNEVIKSLLIEHELPLDETVLIKRVHNQKNQKKFYINDTLVTQKLITDIASLLIDYHGQNMHNYLATPTTHLKILDSFAKLEELTTQLSDKYRQWKNIEEDIDQITKRRAQIEGEKSYLEFVVNELTKANIINDEEDTLSNARIELQNQAKQESLITDTLSLMNAQAFEAKLMQMQKTLSKSAVETKFAQIIELLDQALINYSEAKDLLNSLQDSGNLEYKNLDEVEERLFFIRGLARKYNTTSNGLTALLTESEETLKTINHKLENSELLQKKLASAKYEYLTSAKTLSEQRQAAATKLEASINQELQFLKMEKAIFKVDVKELAPEEARITGIDEVRLLASTNPGIALAPIDKIASGGELSRLMLAFKVVTHSNSDSTPTMIFDEIDTGLGGLVASLIGDRLKKLSQEAQIISITHQPQVAGKANQHILVKKIQKLDHTDIKIKSLNSEEKLQEIARMLSGKQITEAAKEAALELMHE